MHFVGMFWHSHFKQWLQQLQRYQERQQKEALDLAKMEARNTKEDIEKLRDMKTAIFGRYISRVPLYHYGRYKDGEETPLHVDYNHFRLQCLVILILPSHSIFVLLL